MNQEDTKRNQSPQPSRRLLNCLSLRLLLYYSDYFFISSTTSLSFPILTLSPSLFSLFSTSCPHSFQLPPSLSTFPFFLFLYLVSLVLSIHISSLIPLTFSFCLRRWSGLGCLGFLSYIRDVWRINRYRQGKGSKEGLVYDQQL